MSSSATPLTPLIERMARFQATPPPLWNRRTKSSARRAELEAIDRAVLEQMQTQGFLPTLPLSGDVDLNSPIADSVSYTVPGQAGSVWIKSDYLGRVDTEIGLNTADAAIWVRWHFLLHEAAHCQFTHEPVRFKPSPGRLDESVVAALNTWQFGPLTRPGDPLGVVLNECFADTYAAMMLLEVSHHAPKARQTIEDVVDFRRSASQACESTYTRSSEMSDSQAFLGTHHTDGALTMMLAQVQAWKGQPATQIKQLALQYASDALLDWAHPDRPQALGGSQGPRIWNDLVPSSLPLMSAITLMVSLHLAGSDAQAYVRDTHGDHPMAPALLELWDALSTQVGALPATVTIPLVEGLQRYTPGVDHRLAHLTQTCWEASSATAPSMETAEASFTQARVLIETALQKAVIPAQSTWRQWRSDQTIPTASSHKMNS